MTDTVSQTLTVLVLLIVVSAVVAVIIQAIVVAMGRTAERAKRAERAKVPTAPPEPTAGAGDGRPPPEHVAAIAAAVSVVFEDGQVVHIEPVRHDSSWTASGRQAHHTSHHLGHRGSRRPGPQPRS